VLLTKTFSADEYARALDAWRWLGVEGKTPVLTSQFGDVFLQDAAGYWFLDTLEGTLTHTRRSRDEVQAALDSEDGQDSYLMGAFAANRDRAGITLGPSEVYAFSVPPRLGGPIDLDHVTVMPFVVIMRILGQVHQQADALPPGTAVYGMDVDDLGNVSLRTTPD
jgi:hypothetical protein